MVEGVVDLGILALGIGLWPHTHTPSAKPGVASILLHLSTRSIVAEVPTRPFSKLTSMLLNSENRISMGGPEAACFRPSCFEISWHRSCSIRRKRVVRT